MNNLPANVTNITKGLKKAVTRRQISSDGGQFLKLSKAGVWNYGADEIEMEEGALLAINPESFSEGYIAWDRDNPGGPLGEEMTSCMDDPVAKGSLPDVGAPWTEQVAFQAVVINGEDAGVELIYKTSSKGGIKAFNKLINEILRHLEENPGDDKIVPIIELGNDSYKHPKYGRIYTPVLTIAQWASMADTIDSVELTEAEEAAPEPEPEPTRPARRRRAR